MKKRIMAIILCFTMVFTMTGYIGLGDYTFAYAEDNTFDVPENETESVTQSEEIIVATLYEKLNTTNSLEDFRAIMMAEEYREDVLELQYHEIEVLMKHVDSLYKAIETPTEDDIYTHEELLETLMWLPAMECSECGEIGGHTAECVRNIQILPSSGTVNATNINSNQTWNLNGDITLNGTITVKSGYTLKIYNDSVTRTIKRSNGFSGDMFYVEEGATLHINGTGGAGGGCYDSWDGAIVVDGNANVTATSQIIDCSGKLSLRDTVIRNNKGYNAIWLGASGSGTPVDVHHKTTIEITRTLIEKSNATTAGGIMIAGNTPSNYTVEIWDSMIYKCTAVDGSAIYFANNGQAQVIMKESVVDDCDTIDTLEDSSGYYGGALRTNGNGRFNFTMQDSILRNCDSWKFGGGIYWNATGVGSQLTVTDCQFLDNSAAEMGGGLFLEGSNMTITASKGTPTDAKRTGMPGDNITGTLIQGNSAPNGGGISYKCYSNSVEIQVPTTVANFNENVIFDNNTGRNGPALAYNLHDTHNYPNGATFTFNINGATFTNNSGNGYGGAIYVRKCRTDYKLTVNFNSGTITDNNAKYGGAIAIVTDSGVTVGGTVNMLGGTLSDNTATDNGGALYLQKGDFNLKGGAVKDNIAVNGGAACIEGGDFVMRGGTLSNNEASMNGGAAYIVSGSYSMESGTISGNTANKDGGAVYVNGGTVTIGLSTCEGTGTHSHPILQNNEAQNGGAIAVTTGTPIMYCGNFSGNTAEENGGAIYVANGGFTMHGGTIDGGTLPVDAVNAKLGGAVYVSGGNFTMSSGSIQNNIATNNGGAVFTNSGNFVMTSGVITKNRTIANGSNGGGVYVKGGSITIGVKDCKGEDTNHSVSPLDKPHPIITENKAMDSGGGIALIGDGSIAMYCGKVITNEATNPGRGLNVYMEQGDFHLYNADIGAPTDPELVIVGGNLINHNKQPENPENNVILNYYHCNVKTHIHDTLDFAVKTANATKDSYFNLPDGENYWTAEKGYKFFGWTFYGPDTDAAKLEVRDKKDYKPLGDPINVLGSIDGSEDDNIIHMYALWAPEKSNITYTGVVINGVYESETLNMTGNPVEYHFNVGSNVITLNAPVKDGYTFTGWYLYQNEGQNTNWGDSYEPVYAEGKAHTYENLDFAAMSDQFLAVGEDGKYNLEAGYTNFGNITLVAAFEPAYADLKITKEGWDDSDENQTFIFEVTGKPYNKKLADINMTVTICGDGSTLIKDLPVGDYQVKEVTQWGWRYNVDGANPKDVTIDDPKETVESLFSNDRSNKIWLSGDSYCENIWKNSAIDNSRKSTKLA